MPFGSRDPEERRQRPDRDLEIELAGMLGSHAEREGSALSAYHRLAERSEDPAVRYLAQLIAEDEERHHRVIAEMLNQVHSVLWELDVEPGVPGMRKRVDPELREKVDELLHFEREDARELRRLRREARRLPKSSLLPLLVELMIHDTEKHIRILRFMRSHTARR